LGQTVKNVVEYKDSAGAVIYYIVYLDPNGFVIVSADDLVEPIVGFVTGVQYDPSEATPLGALVSRDLANRNAEAVGKQLDARRLGKALVPSGRDHTAMKKWESASCPTTHKWKVLWLLAFQASPTSEFRRIAGRSRGNLLEPKHGGGASRVQLLHPAKCGRERS